MLIIRQGASTINYSRFSSHFTFFSFRSSEDGKAARKVFRPKKLSIRAEKEIFLLLLLLLPHRSSSSSYVCECVAIGRLVKFEFQSSPCNFSTLPKEKSPRSEIFKFNDIKCQAAWAEQKEFAFWRNKRTNSLRPPKAFLSAGTSRAKRLFKNEIMRTNKNGKSPV